MAAEKEAEKPVEKPAGDVSELHSVLRRGDWNYQPGLFFSRAAGGWMTFSVLISALYGVDRCGWVKK